MLAYLYCLNACNHLVRCTEEIATYLLIGSHFFNIKTLPAWNAVCWMQNADALISPANVKMCEIGAICYLRCSCAIKCANWTPNPNQLNLNWLFMSMLICMSIITFFTLNTRTIALHLHQLHGASDADSLWLRHLKHFIVKKCLQIVRRSCGRLTMRWLDYRLLRTVIGIYRANRPVNVKSVAK